MRMKGGEREEGVRKKEGKKGEQREQDRGRD